MYRLQGLCPAGYFRFDLGDIDIVCKRIDIDKNGLGAKSRNGADGGKKAVWRGNNLIAGSDVESHERKQQCVAARCAAYRILCPAIDGDLLFKLSDLGAKDKSIRVEHASNGRFDLGPQLSMLFGKIE